MEGNIKYGIMQEIQGEWFDSMFYFVKSIWVIFFQKFLEVSSDFKSKS